MNLRRNFYPGHLKRVANDIKNEIWNGIGSYVDFQVNHARSLDPPPRSKKPEGNPVLPKDFSNWNPEVKIEYVKKYLSENILNYIESKTNKEVFDNSSNTKSNHSKKKKTKKVDFHSLPKPNPVANSKSPKKKKNPTLENIKNAKVEVPKPRTIKTISAPTIDDRSRSWNSRIGYFVTLSDIKAHTEDIQVYASPEVDFDFHSEPEQYLKLGVGDSWSSDWVNSGIIRGIDINVNGKHKLNYVKNADFEI